MFLVRVRIFRFGSGKEYLDSDFLVLDDEISILLLKFPMTFWYIILNTLNNILLSKTCHLWIIDIMFAFK